MKLKHVAFTSRAVSHNDLIEGQSRNSANRANSAVNSLGGFRRISGQPRPMQERDEVLQIAAEPIEAPTHQHIKLASLCVP